jgi:hypothetical protein
MWQYYDEIKEVGLNRNFLFLGFNLWASLWGMWYPEYYVLSLAIILWEHKLSNYVLRSLFDHSEELFVSVMLAFILFYWCSSIVKFTTWSDYAIEDNNLYEGIEEGVDHQQLTEKPYLADLLKLHVTYGFMSFPKFSFPASILKTVFSFSYMIIINICVTAIISGIIIDSFSEKRAQNAEILDDTQNKCMIW